MQGSAAIIQNSTLTGATVLDPQSRKLGQIKDVLLDAQTGQATFVVLDAEAPGSGHAMLVVPYQALRVSFNPADHRQSVVLGLRADQVRAAPQIQNNQWQMLQNPQFLQEARNFYQIRTYYAARPIDNPSPPSVPSVPSTPCPLIQYVVPQPCRRTGRTPGLDGRRNRLSLPRNDRPKKGTGTAAGRMALRPFSQFYGGVGPHLLVPQQNSWVKSGRYACGSAVPGARDVRLLPGRTGNREEESYFPGKNMFPLLCSDFSDSPNHLMVPDVVSWAFRHFLPFAAQNWPTNSAEETIFWASRSQFEQSSLRNRQL